MRLTDLPVTDRPRERLAARGPDSLADRELLALLLGTGGSRGVGAQTLAELLLSRFGSVAGLARATASELATVPGVGAAKASSLVAGFELGRRAASSEPPSQISNTADIAAVAAPLLRMRDRERLVVISCDGGSRVLGCDVVSEGATDRTLFPTREIVVAVLRRDGRSLALAHNHPGGNPTPSARDVEATQRIREAAGIAGLRFLDHVVVADTAWRRVTTAR